MAIDMNKVHEFVGKALGDLGAAVGAALVVIGDKLGLFKAMRSGPVTPAELAQKTGTAERYVREWLAAQAAAGYVSYDPKAERYFLSAEQEECLTNEESPACVVGGFQAMMAAVKTAPKVMEAFRSGKGVGWHEHDPDLFQGTERFFRPGYNANLVASWIPALEGVQAKLERGATVADVGCGHGASTIIMAEAFPKSRFVGFDAHAPSIECARRKARDAGVADRVGFEVADATGFPAPKDAPSGGWDLVACFDCLHDMGDPVGCAAHVRGRLGEGGTWMVVEPFASDRTEENFNPIGRTFSAASAMICVPASLACNGPALGAQAGPARLREVISKGGFKRVRVATQTPFNLVLEARA